MVCFFGPVSFGVNDLAILEPCIEVLDIPSFLSSLQHGYYEYKAARSPDIKDRLMDDGLSRAIRFGAVAFVPLGALLILASYRPWTRGEGT